MTVKSTLGAFSEREYPFIAAHIEIPVRRVEAPTPDLGPAIASMEAARDIARLALNAALSHMPGRFADQTRILQKFQSYCAAIAKLEGP